MDDAIILYDDVYLIIDFVKSYMDYCDDHNNGNNHVCKMDQTILYNFYNEYDNMDNLIVVVGKFISKFGDEYIDKLNMVAMEYLSLTMMGGCPPCVAFIAKLLGKKMLKKGVTKGIKYGVKQGVRKGSRAIRKSPRKLRKRIRKQSPRKLREMRERMRRDEDDEE